MNQLSSWTEKKLQSTFLSQTCTQKRSWSLFGGLLSVWPLWLSESQRNHYIWEVCSANQWNAPKTATPAATIGQQNGPNSPQCLTASFTTSNPKVEQIGLWSFTSFAIFTWPLSNQLPLLQASRQLFARKTLPQPTEGRKCFPRIHQIPKHVFLCYRNKPTHFSLAQMCWL